MSVVQYRRSLGRGSAPVMHRVRHFARERVIDAEVGLVVVFLGLAGLCAWLKGRA
jgi:hypothetical protein